MKRVSTIKLKKAVYRNLREKYPPAEATYYLSKLDDLIHFRTVTTEEFEVWHAGTTQFLTSVLSAFIRVKLEDVKSKLS